MNGDIICENGLKTSIEIPFGDGERVVTAWPNTVGGSFAEGWPSVEFANHNVFRLDAAGNVVWQVKRVELPTRASWESLHEMAKRWHAEGSPDGSYTPEGYLDPFFSLSLDERQAQASAPSGVYRPGCKVYLTTRRWAYVLDVEMGIATCTGDQVK